MGSNFSSTKTQKSTSNKDSWLWELHTISGWKDLGYSDSIEEIYQKALETGVNIQYFLDESINQNQEVNFKTMLFNNEFPMRRTRILT